MRSLAWTDDAACSRVGGDAWFPDDDGHQAAGKRLCQSCRVKAECLEWALANGERHGVWGGLTPRERRALTPA